MRILHVITRMILGGAQENTLLSVLGQMELGHEVRLASGPTTGPEGSLVEEARSRGVDFFEIPTLVRPVRPLADGRAYCSLRRMIREWRPDVVHTHSSKAGVLGRLAAWHEKAPAVVHTIHGLPFHPYQSRFARALFTATEKLAARRCHQLVSVADAMTRKAAAAGVAPPDKFVTVYSGMDMEPFLHAPADRQALRQEYGLPADAIVIGKVARLFELKGHEDLFGAFHWVAPGNPRARLLLVGDGAWRGRLEQMAGSMGIRQRIVFAGLVPHDRVARAIHAMDLVVHCSLREGLARVLPQALLAGKPLISYDVDGAGEVVIPGHTGRLVRPRDLDGLARAIEETLQDLPAARAMARAGRRLCQERFDWRQMARALVDTYRRLLAKA